MTGKEITSKLLACVQKLSNVELLTQTTMIDILEEKNQCYGIVARSADKTLFAVTARAVVWACGGIGGLYEHSTNFPHLTGDALAIALNMELNWNIRIMFRFIRRLCILQNQEEDF